MYTPTILSLVLQTGGASANLSFLAYLDVWLIGGLVLLAVVVVVGKWLWSRLRRPTGERDGYFHDEDYYPDDDYYSEDR